jgi:hypothetical protein
VQELKNIIWKVGEQRRLRDEKQQLEEMEKQPVASADVADQTRGGLCRKPR